MLTKLTLVAVCSAPLLICTLVFAFQGVDPKLEKPVRGMDEGYPTKKIVRNQD